MKSRSLSTDPALLRRVRHGESAAWDQLYRVYFSWLCQWAERKGASRQDAEDAASEVLLTLVEQLPRFRYDANRSFRGFLRHILRQRISKINRLRRVATNQETKLREYLEGEADTESVLDLLIKDEKTLRLVEILPRVARDVDERVWEVWHRVVLRGESPKDVAAKLEIPIGNVYAYKSRVNQRIRKFHGPNH